MEMHNRRKQTALSSQERKRDHGATEHVLIFEGWSHSEDLVRKTLSSQKIGRRQCPPTGWIKPSHTEFCLTFTWAAITFLVN